MPAICYIVTISMVENISKSSTDSLIKSNNWFQYFLQLLMRFVSRLEMTVFRGYFKTERNIDYVMFAF